MKDLIEIPASIIRGGTSKGVYLLEDDLPSDRSLWGPYLLALFGSGDARQIDGIGGADTTTSKCCILGRSTHPDVDVTYTFAQVGIKEKTVFWDINCGNLTASVGVPAILAGLVKPTAPVTRVRVYQTNTRKMVRIDVPFGTEGIPVEGALEVTGVPDTGAPISIDFSQTVGASLGGGVLPTGNRIDRVTVEGVGEIECSIVDLANMCVFVRARDLGYAGIELPDRGPEMAPRFFALKRAAQKLLGMGYGKLTPWPVIVSDPVDYTSFMGTTVRGDSFDVAVRVVGASTPVMHRAFMGTGASCTATAALIPGTIVDEIRQRSRRVDQKKGEVVLAHPSGTMRMKAAVGETASGIVVQEVLFQRTARLIMQGKLYLRKAKLAALTAEISEADPIRVDVPKQMPLL